MNDTHPTLVVGTALLVALSAPCLAAQGPRIDPGEDHSAALRTPIIESSSATFGRGGTGFGAGATFGAAAMSVLITSDDGQACGGSGDYLQVCRVLFVGGTVLSGGLGALIGSMMRRESPSGRVRPTLLGSAAGAMIPFLATLSSCEQEDPANPEYLCGSHGMPNPTITVAAAVAGGLVGYLLGGSRSELRVEHLGPVLMPGAAPGLGMGFSRGR